MDLFISPQGLIRSLYSDLVEFERLGHITIDRASHVEPDERGQWYAHIIEGPTLGPFSKRGDAIAAEMTWLTANRLAPKG